MKILIRLWSIAIIGSIAAICSAKEPELPLEYLVLKEAYGKKIAEIAAEVEIKQTHPLLEKYTAALTRLEDAEAEQGNLDGLVGIRAERKRAAKERGIQASQISKDDPELAKVQRQLLGAIAKIDAARQQKIDAISEKYIGRLEVLRTKYTKAKQVEAAVAVDAEAKRIEKGMSLGKEPEASVAKKADEDDQNSGGLDLEGDWVLVRGDGTVRIKVKISKVGGEVEGEVGDERYLMEGAATLAGEYIWNKRKFAKVRKEGDRSNSWDIVWVRRKGVFLNTGSHYTGWEMIRPESAKEKVGEEK